MNTHSSTALEGNSMQAKIKKLLELDPREYFTVNNSQFECHFLKNKAGDKPFSEWKKDENSPSLFCEAKLRVYDNTDRGIYYDGLVLVQRDDTVDHPLNAVLYVKKTGSETWQSMHTITSIIV